MHMEVFVESSLLGQQFNYWSTDVTCTPEDCLIPWPSSLWASMPSSSYIHIEEENLCGLSQNLKFLPYSLLLCIY